MIGDTITLTHPGYKLQPGERIICTLVSDDEAEMQHCIAMVWRRPPLPSSDWMPCGPPERREACRVTQCIAAGWIVEGNPEPFLEAARLAYERDKNSNLFCHKWHHSYCADRARIIREWDAAHPRWKPPVI